MSILNYFLNRSLRTFVVENAIATRRKKPLSFQR